MELEPLQKRVMAVMFMAAAALALAALLVQGVAGDAAALVAAFLFVYAAAALVSRLPAEWGGERGRAWIGKHVADLGKGFYGVMGLAVFLLLEIDTLRANFSGPEPIRAFLSELGLNWLIGFSLDSLMNFLQALVWPVRVLDTLGTNAALAIGGLCWGILWGVSRVLPADCIGEIVEAGDEEAASR
jgi:hypothetical protein